MESKKIINNLRLLKVKVLLKYYQLLHQRALPPAKKSEKFGKLNNITKYLDADIITLQLNKNNEQQKEYIFNLVELLCSFGKSICLTEFEKIFDNNDFRKLLSINPNITISLRYLLNSYYAGKNVELSYSIKDYCEILDKIEFLCSVAKSNFTQKDEQIMFIITQLADYISFDNENASTKKEEELRPFSSLKSALIDKKTVCIGYSMALQPCLSNLRVECNIVCGNAGKEKPKVLSFFENNHAWNQVKIGNKWYNVDLTFLSTEKTFKYILRDDKTFSYHYNTGTYLTFKCDETYDGRKRLYAKVKNIKNVLEKYDLGNKSTILQYKNNKILYSLPTNTSKEHVKEFSSKDADLDNKDYSFDRV